jgi:hypothetical protein
MGDLSIRPSTTNSWIYKTNPDIEFHEDISMTEEEKQTCPPAVISFFDFALLYIIDKGYQHEIDWSQNVKWENQTPASFIREYVWVVLCSGFKEQYARPIEKRFWSDIEAGKPDPFAIIKHPAKKKAIVSMMSNLMLHFTVLKGIASHDERLTYLRSLPYMGGEALGYQLGRNLGLDLVKPDRWLIRAATRWDYSTPYELCKAIQDWRPEMRIGTIDMVLWRYANLTGRVE